MSRSAILVVLMFAFIVSFGQNISVTFTGTGAATKIDSVTATNLRTTQSIILRGNETLVLALNTGILSISELAEMGLIFPNPFSGKTTFKTIFQKPQSVQLKIQNLIGQVVAQTNSVVQSGENLFSLSVNTAGIYMVSLTSELGMASYKIICNEATETENMIQYKGTVPININNASQSELKSSHSGNILYYRNGDVIHYKCQRGIYTTIVTDSPTFSKNYEVELVPCTDADGKNYSVVKIGNLTWMAENLAYLPSVSSPSSGSSDSSPYYYVLYYQGNSISEAKDFRVGSLKGPIYATYGVLYNWGAAKISCPSGWYLPSDVDWTTLTDYLGTSAGGKMKETGTSHWISPNFEATNSSGFTAIPGGYWGSISGIIPLGYSALFWSAAEHNASLAWKWFLVHGGSGVSWGVNSKSDGFSVRCLKEVGFPTVTTANISNITQVSASAGGEVINEGDSVVTQRGVCWNTSRTPTTSDNKTSDSSGIGIFLSVITGLSAGTLYHVRAYATNSVGTSYGNEISFYTSPILPTVTTLAVTTITKTTALSGGNIVGGMGAGINSRGVCWSTSSNPTLDNSKTSDGIGAGSFKSSLIGLSENTIYYVRAYATNSAGTTYGAEKKFTSLIDSGTLVDSRDNHEYKVKSIGTQIWMTENLAYLPEVSPSSAGSITDPYYYVYDYQGWSVIEAKATANYATYGVLYNWKAAKTACPSGWHLPSNTEWWTILIEYLKSNGYGYYGGTDSHVAKSLAATSGWTSYSKAGTVGNDQPSNNRSGFKALPAGHCDEEAYRRFSLLGNSTYFWASLYNASNASILTLDFNQDSPKLSWYLMSNGSSIRCLKN